jgi:heme exporter protein A
MGSTILKIDSVSCERDDRLLFTGLSYVIDSGDIVQLEGPNGAGKTTLLRILSGLFTSYEGRIHWFGGCYNNASAEEQPQQLFIGHKSAVNGSLSALENLRYLVGLQQKVIESELWGALEQVGLMGYEHVLCRNLSAGQQRRVSLARLHLSRAPIWILDEIFTAIDKAGVKQLERLLAKKAQEGKTIILTTHHQLNIPGLRTLSLLEYASDE